MTDTAETMVPAESAPAPPPRKRRWLRRLIVAVVVLVALDVAAVTIRLPEYVWTPGIALPVADMVTLPAAQRHPLHGSVMMTAIYEYKARPIDVARSWFDHNIAIVPQQDVTGGLTPSQIQQLDQQEMGNSKEVAEVVALRRLGYTVPEHGTGALVDEVQPKTPASHAVSVGDTIVAVGSTPVHLEQDAAAAIAAVPPGHRVSLTVENPKGARRTVSVTLAARPGQPSKGFLGVGLTTRNEKFDFPLKVNINAEGIGGPSAGLAFTLGLLDELSNGNLTGGARVAATGTIGIDGTVGDVGGVAQKAVSVRAAGATLFLVPPAEYATAKAHAGGMRVVAVSTLQQALDALGRIGGDVAALPPAPSQ